MSSARWLPLGFKSASALTLPSSGRAFGTPLKSNVRPASVKPLFVEFAPLLGRRASTSGCRSAFLCPVLRLVKIHSFGREPRPAQEIEGSLPAARAMFSERNSHAHRLKVGTLLRYRRGACTSSAGSAQASSVRKSQSCTLGSKSRRFIDQWRGAILQHRPPGLTLRCSGLPSAAAELKR